MSKWPCPLGPIRITRPAGARIGLDRGSAAGVDHTAGQPIAAHRARSRAAHGGDLRAAGALGLRTAFVSRPDEWGEGAETTESPPEGVDLAVSSFVELAERLGA